jgi:hypothetical protein
MVMPWVAVVTCVEVGASWSQLLRAVASWWVQEPWVRVMEVGCQTLMPEGAPSPEYVQGEGEEQRTRWGKGGERRIGVACGAQGEAYA